MASTSIFCVFLFSLPLLSRHIPAIFHKQFHYYYDSYDDDYDYYCIYYCACLHVISKGGYTGYIRVLKSHYQVATSDFEDYYCNCNYYYCEDLLGYINMYFLFLIVACGKLIYVFGGYNGLERKHHGEVYSLNTGTVNGLRFCQCHES